MHRSHVSAGTYFVGSKQPLVLEAYLGTCVGVALIDPQAGVGGLGHFLLPEPVSSEGPFHPQRYASSGLPLLLEAACAAGARPDRLKAVVAGGALVGPLNDIDLELNIGGRTTERVVAFLRQEGIPIAQEETGGFFTCCLSLDLQTLAFRIDPAGCEKIENRRSEAVPSAGDIDHVVEKLQPVPQVALRIMQLFDSDDEYDIRELTAEIRKDQVISARTLKLANSVMFAPHHRIESLDHALLYLGMNLLMKFVIAAAVDGLFTQSGSGYSLCKGGLYQHAVGTAVVAEKLARRTAAAKPGQAYTAGLLHDIGKVVLDQHVAAAYPLLYRSLSQNNGRDFTECERSQLGTDHTEAGLRLARSWSFPDPLAESIRHHHHPEGAERHPELVHIVHVADLLMTMFRAGLETEQMGSSRLAERLSAIGLSTRQFAEIVDMIPENLFAADPSGAIHA
jgi:putative nucleotidyltransferase with HDIG domain